MNQENTDSNRYSSISACEMQLCRIVWDCGPINSTKLKELCFEQLGWSKSTAFTYIRRLCEKGILANENAVVRILVSEETVHQARLKFFVNQEFDGSPVKLLKALIKILPCINDTVDQFNLN